MGICALCVFLQVKMFVNFHMLIQAYKTKLTNIFIQNMAKTHAHKISRMCMRALTHTHTHTHKGWYAHSANKKHAKMVQSVCLGLSQSHCCLTDLKD